MGNSKKTVWYAGKSTLQCNSNDIQESLLDIGKHFKEIVSLMPGLTSVELIEQGDDFVHIKTNEGLMKRTNIAIEIKEGKIIMQFDEEYQAGKMITAHSHFMHEFIKDDSSIIHQIQISNLNAPGVVGFFYKNFGSKNIGNAFLEVYKNYFNQTA